MYLMYRLPFLECLMFGALISATDPVTVLSIFQVIFLTLHVYFSSVKILSYCLVGYPSHGSKRHSIQSSSSTRTSQ